MRPGDLVRFREGCSWDQLGHLGLVLAVRHQGHRVRWDALVGGRVYSDIVYVRAFLEVIDEAG